ncbi:MAG: helix-turn-helix domain-containing protein [Patescibacteria group bacterium]
MPQEKIRISPINAALVELGTSELERKLYSVSLSVGSTSIATLAERMGISRPNIYKVIRGLELKGLATFGGGKRYIKSFQVASPSVVMEKLREKRKELGSIDEALSGEIADLLAKYDQGKGPANMRVIRGRKDFAAAYVQVFEEAKGEIQFLGSYDDFLREISPDLGARRIDRRVERGIKIRALALPSAQAEALQKKDTEELREIRFLKSATPFTCSFYLFANKAIFWQPITPVAVLIEDEHLVAMWRSMFEMLWSVSEK